MQSSGFLLRYSIVLTVCTVKVSVQTACLVHQDLSEIGVWEGRRKGREKKSVRETNDAISYGRSNSGVSLSPPSPSSPSPTYLGHGRCWIQNVGINTFTGHSHRTGSCSIFSSTDYSSKDIVNKHCLFPRFSWLAAGEEKRSFTSSTNSLICQKSSWGGLCTGRISQIKVTFPFSLKRMAAGSASSPIWCSPNVGAETV